MVMTLSYTKALEMPLPKPTMNDEQIEIKVYAPFPYADTWSDTDPVQKCFQLGDEFYNVVERRYEQDTMHLTLQRNLGVRDKFDALSSILNTLSASEKSRKQTPLRNSPSAKDFMTVFSPSTAPILVCGHSYLENSLSAAFWHYQFHLPSGYVVVPAPPPDFV